MDKSTVQYSVSVLAHSVQMTKYLTTYECLSTAKIKQQPKSFEVDSSHMPSVKSSQVECDHRLGVVLASSRVTFLYRSDSQV